MEDREFLLKYQISKLEGVQKLKVYGAFTSHFYCDLPQTQGVKISRWKEGRASLSWRPRIKRRIAPRGIREVTAYPRGIREVTAYPRGIRGYRLSARHQRGYSLSTRHQLIHEVEERLQLIRGAVERFQILRSTWTQRQPSMRVMLKWLWEFRIFFKHNLWIFIINHLV